MTEKEKLISEYREKEKELEIKLLRRNVNYIILFSIAIFLFLCFVAEWNFNPWYSLFIILLPSGLGGWFLFWAGHAIFRNYFNKLHQEEQELERITLQILETDKSDDL